MNSQVKYFRRFWLAGMAAVLALPLSTGFASAEVGKPIEFIRVEGTQRVEGETVRAYMVVREGVTDRSDLVDQSVKTLFSSGLFADVTIRREGQGLVVVVVEMATATRNPNHPITFPPCHLPNRRRGNIARGNITLPLSTKQRQQCHQQTPFLNSN